MFILRFLATAALKYANTQYVQWFDMYFAAKLINVDKNTCPDRNANDWMPPGANFGH